MRAATSFVFASALSMAMAGASEPTNCSNDMMVLYNGTSGVVYFLAEMQENCIDTYDANDCKFYNYPFMNALDSANFGAKYSLQECTNFGSACTAALNSFSFYINKTLNDYDSASLEDCFYNPNKRRCQNELPVVIEDWTFAMAFNASVFELCV